MSADARDVKVQRARSAYDDVCWGYNLSAKAGVPAQVMHTIHSKETACRTQRMKESEEGAPVRIHAHETKMLPEATLFPTK